MATYQGREVELNKPFRTPDEDKKFAVYVKNDKGNVVIVRFGDDDMEIKRDDPEARKNFRARHNCSEKKDKTTAGYWSCKFWGETPVSKLLDRSVPFESKIDNYGFLKVDAIIARTGIQDYLGTELGEDTKDMVGVFRPAEEVTNKQSVQSFINVPITDNHPSEMVTIDNYKNYAKGSISDVKVVDLGNGEKGLRTTITITDAQLINKIKEGKKELSVGYENQLVKKEGVYRGKPYKYMQTDIIANHVAVVDAGRCGNECKLLLDNLAIIDNENLKKGKKMIINGKEVSQEEAQKAFDALQSQLDAYSKKDMEEMDSKISDMEKEMEKLKAERDKMAKDMEEKEKSMDADVAEKVKLLTIAKDVEVEAKPCDATLDIKKAIVSSFDIKVDDKSSEYLDAVIDMKVTERKEKEAAARKSYDSAADYKAKSFDWQAIANKDI